MNWMDDPRWTAEYDQALAATRQHAKLVAAFALTCMESGLTEQGATYLAAAFGQSMIEANLDDDSEEE